MDISLFQLVADYSAGRRDLSSTPTPPDHYFEPVNTFMRITTWKQVSVLKRVMEQK